MAGGGGGISCITSLDFDLFNPAFWCPLFETEKMKRELIPNHVSTGRIHGGEGQLSARVNNDSVEDNGSISAILTLQDGPLTYKRVNSKTSKALQARLEDDIWRRFLKERSM